MSTYTHDNLSWLNFQHIKKSEFRICLKELFADQHDPVTVSYVLLAGEYFYITKTKWLSNALTKFWFTYGQRTGMLRACFSFFFIFFFFCVVRCSVKTFASLAGHTSLVFATPQVSHARTGLKLKRPAKETMPTWSLLKLKKQMFTFSTVLMERRVGSDWMTETPRAHLFGLVISRATSHIGLQINLTISD